jgi:hypothetical protein
MEKKMDIPNLTEIEILEQVKIAKIIDLKRLLSEWKTENSEPIIDEISSKINNCETIDELTELDVALESNFILKSLDFLRNQKIFKLKNIVSNELAKTDYKIWKYQEGQLTNEEYETVKGLRQKIRNKYNETESKILIAETIAELEKLEKDFQL